MITRLMMILAALATLLPSGPAWATDKPLVIEGAKIKQLPASTTLQVNASGTGAASINIPHGTAPSSPANGDCWTSTSAFSCRINGATASLNGSNSGDQFTSIANGSILGNNSGSTGAATALTAAQATALLSQFSSTLQGVVPGSGGGTTNFLRADGSWAAPAGSGGTVTTTGAPASGNLTKFSGATSVTNGDLSGDVTTSGTLATTLTTSGVTAGSYTDANITVDAKGRVTAASNGAGGGGGGTSKVWDFMWGANNSASTGAFAFKGLRVIPRQTIIVDGLATDLVTPVNGATYVAYIVSMSSTTAINTVLGTSSTFTASGTSRINPLLFTFASGVTLTSGSAYSIIIGCTSSTGTTALPVPSTSTALRYTNAPLQNDGFVTLTTAPANGATLTYGSTPDGYLTGVRWQTN